MFKKQKELLSFNCHLTKITSDKIIVKLTKMESQGNEKIRIKVVGLLTTIAFQKAKLFALKLHRYLNLKFAEPEIIEMLEFDWYEYLHQLQLERGGKTWDLKRQTAVFWNDEFIGNDVDFYQLISNYDLINLPSDFGYYEILTIDNYRKFLDKTKRTFAYLTFSVDGEIIGSLLFMLFSDLLPKTCEYFMNFCKEKQLSNGKSFSYKGTNVHRIAKNGWIQCGALDIETLKSEFIHELMIPDENYSISHNKRGIISLSKDEKHSNGPQFIISLKSNLWMDNFFVAFGELVDGVKTLQLIEEIPVCREKPLKDIKLDFCGEYSCEKGFSIFKKNDSLNPIQNVRKISDIQEFHSDENIFLESDEERNFNLSF